MNYVDLKPRETWNSSFFLSIGTQTVLIGLRVQVKNELCVSIPTINLSSYVDLSI